MGGGGFTMGEHRPALDRLVLELTAKRVPKVCFLPTASGDPREQLIGFRERFNRWGCEPSVLSLFHLGRDRVDPEAHLLAQDAIYVGGGSMRNMLAIWREHGIDRVMKAAWEAGVVLAGLSAGAMCWFEGGLSLSGGAPEPVAGIGLLPGSLSVHRDSEPQRLPAYLDAVERGQLPQGFAADDGTALVYAGRRLVECVASEPGLGVSRIEIEDGRALERPMAVRLLRDAEGARALATLAAQRAEAELAAVQELRTLRALRQRWD
jgi:dipeptidase E